MNFYARTTDHRFLMRFFWNRQNRLVPRAQRFALRPQMGDYGGVAPVIPPLSVCRKHTHLWNKIAAKFRLNLFL